MLLLYRHFFLSKMKVKDHGNHGRSHKAILAKSIVEHSFVNEIDFDKTFFEC